MIKQFLFPVMLLINVFFLFSGENPCDQVLKAADTAFARKDYESAYKEYEKVITAGCINGAIYYRAIYCAEMIGELTPADHVKYYFYSYILLNADNSGLVYIEDARKKMYPPDKKAKEIILMFEKAVTFFSMGDYPACCNQYREAFRKRESSGISSFDPEFLLLYQYGYACEKTNGLADEAIAAYFASYENFTEFFYRHAYYAAMTEKMKANALAFLAYAVEAKDTMNFKTVLNLAGSGIFKEKNAADTYYLAIIRGTADIRLLLEPYFFSGILSVEKQLQAINILLSEKTASNKRITLGDNLLYKLIRFEAEKEENAANLKELAAAYKLDYVIEAIAALDSQSFSE